MPKFKLYAGLGGGFGGAHYHGTYEFKTQEEADRAAYELAWEEYESYGGHHGLDDWEGVYVDCVDSGWITDDMSPHDIEQVVNDAYLETVESWITWYAKEVDPILDWHGDGEDDDDDADCYCE